MNERIERLKAELAELSVDERAELGYFLLESLPPEKFIEDDAAWAEELQRRLAEINSGKDVGIPAEQVIAELRAKYA